MEPNLQFSAPWGYGLRATSWAATVLFCGVAAFGYWQPGLPELVRWTLMLLPPLMLAGGAIGTVRGYELGAGELRIRRLFWDTRIPLEGLRAIEPDPEATRGSLRLFGNGGLYSYSGLFWNRRLGRYRLYATDPSRAVVLRFERRVVVVSPDKAAEFVRVLRGRISPG